jgi:hypothetical protein
MIFRRKKPSATSGSDQPVMRGRENANEADNPLARRFHPDDEPDTIDLQEPAGFTEEPDTAGTETKGTEPDRLSVITRVAETGKFYVQPGQGDEPVYLGSEPVRAPTELRHGDRIRVGDVELHILPAQK